MAVTVQSELAHVFGTKSRLGIIEELARNGPQRQVELARSLNVTQATISREKRELIQSGVIREVVDEETGQSMLAMRKDYEALFEGILQSLRLTDHEDITTDVTEVEL